MVEFGWNDYFVMPVLLDSQAVQMDTVNLQQYLPKIKVLCTSIVVCNAFRMTWSCKALSSLSCTEKMQLMNVQYIRTEQRKPHYPWRHWRAPHQGMFEFSPFNMTQNYVIIVITVQGTVLIHMMSNSSLTTVCAYNTIIFDLSLGTQTSIFFFTVASASLNVTLEKHLFKSSLSDQTSQFDFLIQLPEDLPSPSA